LLEDRRDDIINNTDFYNSRRNAVIWARFKKCQKLLFVIGSIISIFIIIFLYFHSSNSNILKITIEGNYYYTEEIILKLAKFNQDDKFVLVNTSEIKDNIAKDCLFDSITITKENNNEIKIVVSEKYILGYIYEDGLPYLLLEDDSRIIIDEERLYLIAYVPLIEGYSKNGLLQIEKGLKKVDRDILEKVSEIHCYPFSYDEYMMEVIMDDGNYIFSSANDFKNLTLSYYYEAIYNLKSTTKVCLYLNVTNSNVTLQYRGCPWMK